MNKCRGFTLIEVLISLAIFMLIALAFGRFTQMQLRSWSVVEKIALGEIVAINAMEHARSPAFDNFTGQIESKDEVAGLAMNTITQIRQTDVKRYRKISIEVSLDRNNGRPDEVLYRLQGARYASQQE
ncbi:MAG: prepilin-type N-terminal cleavage/methylation domain-containing protein [Halioglobus sp.]